MFYLIDKCVSSTIKCQRNGYPNPKNCKTCLCPDGFSGDLCEKIADSTS